MNLSEIQQIARDKGINPVDKWKVDLIREIQIKEGNEPCYGTKFLKCDNLNCLWRKDCCGMIRYFYVG